jgi:hypothetical protein
MIGSAEEFQALMALREHFFREKAAQASCLDGPSLRLDLLFPPTSGASA